MKKKFVNPFCEVVRFGHADVVCTSSECSCVSGGIDWGTDDEVCPSGDAECDIYCVDP